MCISTENFDSIFFSELRPFWTKKIGQNERYFSTQFVSATPLKPLNRISWNFVVMKEIMCRYTFLQEMLIWSFWGAIYIPFFVLLPLTDAWNCHSLCTAFSSNVGAWGMWACSLFLSFLKSIMVTLNAKIKRNQNTLFYLMLQWDSGHLNKNTENVMWKNNINGVLHFERRPWLTWSPLMHCPLTLAIRTIRK